MATISKRPRKDGGDWWRAQIQIRRDGEPVYRESRTFHLRRNAESWANAREAELENPALPQEADISGITLGQLLDAYINDTGVRIGRAKHSHLKLLKGTALARNSLATLDQSQIIEHVRDQVDAGTEPVTVNNELIWLRTVALWAQPFAEYPISVEEIESALTYCRLSGYIARTQMRNRRLSADELWRLSEYFTEHPDPAGLPMQDLMWFAIHSARRLTEITQLLWSENDYAARTGRVRDPGYLRPGQGGNEVFQYTVDAWEIVQRQPRIELRIFPYDSVTIGAAFTHACHQLEIQDLRFQDLRHEAICRLFEARFSLPDIKQITLIRDWQTLGKYTHLNARDTPSKKGMKA